MELRSRTLTAKVLHPAEDFAPVRAEVEVRWDPLTGHTSRLIAGKNLMPPNDYDLAALADATRPTCPFCRKRIERATPKLVPDVAEEGRIRRGRALLFPNLIAYSRHSSVSVYSPDLHLLPLEEMTDELVSDNLACQVAFARAATAADPESSWASINANHMLPSGSSLFHPHLQGSVDPVPTTLQAHLAELPAIRFSAYLDAERGGPRDLGGTGRVRWLAGFAPLAPGELRAFVDGVASPAELDDDLVAELGHGIATALRLYAEMGFESFNLATYGAPPGRGGYPLNLRLVCRSNLREPAYRSDATYFERLHWESAVDLFPEELAERAGDRFRG